MANEDIQESCGVLGKKCGNWKTKKGGWDCKVCGKIFRTRAEKTAHLKSEHKEYYENRDWCRWKKGLTKETSEIVKLSGQKTHEGYKKGRLKHYWKGKHHSEASKKKMSESQKDNIRKNPNLAPYSAFHRKGKVESYAETYFRKLLERNNIDFKQEFQINLYSLDFLVGNVDLEIDGEQHYTVKNQMESDARRTEFLNENGFRVYRIRWSWFKGLPEEEKQKYILKLVSFLKSNEGEEKFPKIVKYNKKKIKPSKPIFRSQKIRIPKKRKICPICGKEMPFRQKYCSYECLRKTQREHIPSKEELLKKIEEIGFNKVQLGKFYGVSDNAVNKWLIKYGIPKSRKEFKIWLELR